MSYSNIKFQWYDKGIFNNRPKGLISLNQFYESIKNPKPKLKKAFKGIEKAGKAGDLKLKDFIKQEELFFVTPSITVKEFRRYEDIVSYNPFLVAEYDKILCPELMRDYIFEKFDSCIMAFCSPSKTGAKFIFRIPVVNSIKEYKEYFWGLAFILDKFTGFDTANQNCSLPLFCSWDEDAKYREDASEWLVRGYKEDAFDFSKVKTEASEVEADSEMKKKLVDFISNAVRSINDNAHPQIRSFALTWGGFTAYYGLDIKKSFEFLRELVINNEYMSKNTNGYLKTVEQFFNKGLDAPIEFVDYE